MHYSTLRPLDSRQEVISAFGGYDHHLRCADGAFYNMRNITGDDYPLLSARRQRGFVTGGSHIRTLLAKDMLCYADGEDLVIGDTHIPLGLQSGDTQLISMGAYVVILPDGVYVNTADPADRGQIEASFEGAAAQLRLCREDGTDITLCPDPENPADGDWRLSQGLQRWSETASAWIGEDTTYVKLLAEGVGRDFQVGDGLHITGLPQVGSTGIVVSKSIDFLVFPGILDAASIFVENVSLTRRLPKMDFCLESGNRLWGCRYGLDRDGVFVNELYASKLGDFTNWECFAGLSTDSYRVSLGSDGVFTGAVTYLGQPLFFKEGQLHRVYGLSPSSFQIQSDACQGVQRGSGGSLAVVGETLYYKSRLGVCAYDGSLPMEVSAPLGDVAYHSAVAGAHGGKYYISMADDGEQWHLFVYDTRRGFWHREDETRVVSFASWGNDLYFLDGADGCIKTVFGSGSGNVEGPISWMVETGLIGAAEPGHKYLSHLRLRLRLTLGSTADVYAEYDSSGVWEYAGSIKGTGMEARDIPIRPRRCDHLRLRLEGKGKMTLFSMAKTIC